MKLSKLLTASLAIASLAALPVVLPASAQTDGSTNGTTTSDTNRSTNNTSYQDDGRDDNNWGWLGLLGLGGLAGLGNRRKTEVTRRYDDADVVSRSTTSSHNR